MAGQEQSQAFAARRLEANEIFVNEPALCVTLGIDRMSLDGGFATGHSLALGHGCTTLGSSDWSFSISTLMFHDRYVLVGVAWGIGDVLQAVSASVGHMTAQALSLCDNAYIIAQIDDKSKDIIENSLGAMHFNF